MKDSAMEQKESIYFQEQKDCIKISFDTNYHKFGTKHLDLFADGFYKFLDIAFKQKKKFVFDLSSLEWIAHEELVYLSGILDQLYLNDIEFNIILKSENKTDRQKKTIIYLWEKWQIFSFIDRNDILKNIFHYFDLNNYSDETKKNVQIFFNKTESEFEGFWASLSQQNNNDAPFNNRFFDIDINYINQIKQELENEADEYYAKITPFVKLIIPDNNGIFDEKVMSENIKKVYALDEKTIQLLTQYSHNTPFLNGTLSSILTKELYENSIEHAYVGKKVKKPACYLSVSLLRNISEGFSNIQKIKEWNFRNEAIPESRNFYKKGDKYTNQSYIQFTFLDFGMGIPDSLRKIFPDLSDTDIILKSFEYSTSRHPLSEKYLEKDSIPRGLFDVISIVKRYKGLIIIRSNRGKLLYDFSVNGKNINDCAIKYDISNSKFFNGTMISILIPENHDGISLEKIKPQYLIEATKKKNHYLSILEIQKRARKSINSDDREIVKKEIYNKTLDDLGAFLDEKQNENCCVLIDFNGCHLHDIRIAKKILFFLASDYRINEKTNAVIINPPHKDIVLSIQQEILLSPEEKKKLIYHPLPCVFQSENRFEILWIGISEETSYLKLNQVLYSDIHDNISLSDFDNERTVQESGFFTLDEYGNVKSLIKNINDLSIDVLASRATVEKADSIYLCAGNYYQKKYIGCLEQLYDAEYSNFISTLLYEKFKDSSIKLSKMTHDNNVKFLAITLSSQLLGKSVISRVKDEDKALGEKMEDNFVRLSNYHSFYLEDDFVKNIKENDKVIIICDVISTGFLISSLKQKLETKRASLIGVVSVFDTRKKDNAGNVPMSFEPDIPTICLRNIPLDKYRRDDANIRIENKNIIRINPAINTPITLDINKSEIDATVLFPDNNEFLSKIQTTIDYIQIGYYKHNKLFHPYFFNTNKLFKSDDGRKLMRLCLERIQYIHPEITINEIDFIFYPIFSGAEAIDCSDYRSEVFEGVKIEFVPIGRFNTPNGWRYTFPPKIMNSKTKGKNVFIIDDGSCTGSTIIQMIDEISFLDVKSINVLSLFGRIDDYLREFFSRIKSIKVRHINNELLNSFGEIPDNQLNYKIPFDVSAKDFFAKIRDLEVQQIGNELIISIKEEKNIIPINIFFGSQWQIQTYPLGANFPFHDEQMMLEHFKELEHLPKMLSKYIDERIERMELTGVNEEKPTNYLPKENGIVPKVEMLKIRTEIGKINGYRFYKNYFDFFNNYVKDYHENSKDGETQKQTEIILGVLLHEPYLIRAMKDFLPDVYGILMSFTQDIIENNVSLKYEWSYASKLSIYLNLRKDDIDSITSSINIIIKFILNDTTQNTLNLFFTFVLIYVPQNKKQLHKQEDGVKILKALSEYLENNNNNDLIIHAQLKIFVSFLNTLPTLDKELQNKDVGFSKLNLFYNDEKSFHKDESIEKLLGVIKTQSRTILSSDNDDEKNDSSTLIKTTWNNILPTLERFQRYCERIDDVFRLYNKSIIYDQLFAADNNFRQIFAQINNIVAMNQIISNSEQLHNYVSNQLLPNFFSEESHLYRLFKDFNTKNIIDIWKTTFESIENLKIGNDLSELNKVNELTIQFPKLFLLDLLFEQVIRKNFEKHADMNNDIIVLWKIDTENHILSLTIDNKIKENDMNGGRNGTVILEKLNGLFGFSFKISQPKENLNNNYTQSYKFKIYYNG
jgi:hypoxanthine-guanine phosphoribosyltransferase